MTTQATPAGQVPVVGKWRKSRFSDGGHCVELAATHTGVALRNSNHPDAGTLALTRSQLQDIIGAVKAGELDPLS